MNCNIILRTSKTIEFFFAFSILVETEYYSLIERFHFVISSILCMIKFSPSSFRVYRYIRKGLPIC
jgi:hypothetical protein